MYPCKPGGPNDYVALVLAGDAWDTVLALAGRADLIGDPRYATAEAREAHIAEVEEIVGSWTRTVTKHEAMKTFTDLGFPAGAVQDSLEVLDDLHLKVREMVVDIHDPVRGDYQVIGCPIKIESSDVEVKPPPLLGEHTEEVLNELLGITSAEVGALRDEGVV